MLLVDVWEDAGKHWMASLEVAPEGFVQLELSASRSPKTPTTAPSVAWTSVDVSTSPEPEQSSTSSICTKYAVSAQGFTSIIPRRLPRLRGLRPYDIPAAWPFVVLLLHEVRAMSAVEMQRPIERDEVQFCATAKFHVTMVTFGLPSVVVCSPLAPGSTPVSKIATSTPRPS